MIHTKLATGVSIEADQGLVTATFSRFGVVDHDGDVTLPTAFEDGAEVVISSYNHTSWQGALPVGRGTIHTDAEAANVSAQFFMSTESGRDTFQVIKSLGDLCEWSYGFDILDQDYETVGGQQIRILKRLKVYEVSPVLRGAGIGTGTTDAKAEAEREYLRFVYETSGVAGQDRAVQATVDHEYLRFVRSTLEAA